MVFVASTSRLSLAAAVILGLALGTGCAVHHHHRAPLPVPVGVAKKGPPPHAPAHGYRHKHARDGVDLVFDAGIGLYVVVGSSGVYCDGTRYFRKSAGVWQVSVRPRGGWAQIAARDLPSGLRGKVKQKAKAKHGRPHPPAKHGY